MNISQSKLPKQLKRKTRSKEKLELRGYTRHTSW